MAANPGPYQPMVLQPGAANANGKFDQLDLVLVLQAGKYGTGEPATFSEGDWDRDGQFNQLDIVAALATDGYLAKSNSIFLDAHVDAAERL